jgi:hypothetical protein
MVFTPPFTSILRFLSEFLHLFCSLNFNKFYFCFWAIPILQLFIIVFQFTGASPSFSYYHISYQQPGRNMCLDILQVILITSYHISVCSISPKFVNLSLIFTFVAFYYSLCLRLRTVFRVIELFSLLGS